MSAFAIPAGPVKGVGLFDAAAYLRNEQSSGTNGGAATTGSYQTVVLNTKVFETVSGMVVLSSNQFTLLPGIYQLEGKLPMFRTGLNRLRFRNVTDSTDVDGPSHSGETTVNGEGTNPVTVFGRVIITASKTFELQYRCASNDGGNTKCLGPAASFGVNEVYGEVIIRREGPVPVTQAVSVVQASHALVVGDVIRLSGSSYTKAKADTAANAEVVGIVSRVVDSSTFEFISAGDISGLSGLTAGSVYFLSPSTAGALTATEPTTTGHVSKPLLIARSTTAGLFFNMRGAVIPVQVVDYFNYFVSR